MELKQIIAKNLKELRSATSYTQIDVAEKLNYSDKAVSKWERGESIPDIAMLKQIAGLYGVTVDYLINESHVEGISNEAKKLIKRNRFIISLLATSLVWLIATIAYVTLALIFDTFTKFWLAFIVAIPVSCIVLLIFNSIWGKNKLNFILISLLIWSVLLSVCLIFSVKNIWILFVIGIPAQIIVLLWSRLKSSKIASIVTKKSRS